MQNEVSNYTAKIIIIADNVKYVYRLTDALLTPIYITRTCSYLSKLITFQLYTQPYINNIIIKCVFQLFFLSICVFSLSIQVRIGTAYYPVSIRYNNIYRHDVSNTKTVYIDLNLSLAVFINTLLECILIQQVTFIFISFFFLLCTHQHFKRSRSHACMRYIAL